MVFKGRSDEYLQLEKIHCNKSFAQKENMESPLTILWFEDDNNELEIDGERHIFNANDIVSLTEFHNVDITGVCNARLLRFNRPFYCIIDHDSEVGCKGMLFFGASQLPVFKIPEEDLEKFETIWKMFELEMNSRDELQQEMLQSMLKRLIILCTRVYKQQNHLSEMKQSNIDIIREFNFLVEKHFKTKHSVKDYAELLHKSSKTISNIFSKFSEKTPLQFIQERKLLEAKRQLQYSNKSIKEIAFDIGFEDMQSFGRFFKNKAKISPSEFRSSK